MPRNNTKNDKDAAEGATTPEVGTTPPTPGTNGTPPLDVPKGDAAPKKAPTVPKSIDGVNRTAEIYEKPADTKVTAMAPITAGLRVKPRQPNEEHVKRYSSPRIPQLYT